MKYLIPALALLVVSTLSLRADNMDSLIQSATKILENRQGSVDPIPNEILANAKGIAIMTITKAGIGIGGQGGEGIVMVRHDNGGTKVWRAPSAFSISGASIGAQLGFTTIRYIIVLNTEAAIGQFVNEGKVKWDATATGTAGEDTATESESTRDLEKHAVLVYRDSGGLFGGATLGGSSITVDDDVNQRAYGSHIYVRDILEGKVAIPPQANRLYDLLDGKRG
jgi:lipid-binding SYLF domain-containing protein